MKVSIHMYLQLINLSLTITSSSNFYIYWVMASVFYISWVMSSVSMIYCNSKHAMFDLNCWPSKDDLVMVVVMIICSMAVRVPLALDGEATGG